MSPQAEPLSTSLKLSESPRTLASIRRVLSTAALRLEAVVLPPDDPRLHEASAKRLDASFYFSRAITVNEAWLALERGLDTLVPTGPSAAPNHTPSRTSAAQLKASAEQHVARLNDIIDAWQTPQLPATLTHTRHTSIGSLQESCPREISRQRSPAERAVIEKALLGWLFTTVKSNVKRQRGHFELDQVLQGYANCLGYAKLFQALAPRFGLDCGIAEVVVDNAGRRAPHQANIFRFSDGTWQLADAWYGSIDIKHRRLGLRLKDHGRWQTRDVDAGDLTPKVRVAGLRRQEIDAITYYIRGNRRLAQGETAQAIDCYTTALRLYPNDSRPRFNRAVAWERLGETEKAKADYSKALKNEAALTRVLAIEHDEVTRLIGLDSQGIGQCDQMVYLLRSGFVTGNAMPESEVAALCSISVEEVARTVERVEKLLG